MSYFDLDNIIRRFILKEDNNNPDIFSHLLIVNEIVEKLKPGSLRETRLLSALKQHMYEIKRCTKKLQEQVTTLQEQVKILEEEKNKKKRK